MSGADVTGADVTGADGVDENEVRRRARAARDSADDLSWSDPRRDELDAEADRLDEQAYRLMLQRVGERPSLEQVAGDVGSEEWLAALALLRLSDAVARDAERWTEWSRVGGRYAVDEAGERTWQPDPGMDWDGWVRDVDERGRGWSSTEARLFELVAALTVTDRTLDLVRVLGGLGSWEREVLSVLVQWASGGNNRDLPGRYDVTRTGLTGQA